MDRFSRARRAKRKPAIDDRGPVLKCDHANRGRAAEPGHRRPLRQRARRSSPPSARRSAPARASSSRPSFRSAATRPKICSCARRFSTPARASSRRSRAAVQGTTVLVGFPERADGVCYNALAVVRDGRVTQTYRKQCLPNYTVFDEERYFEPGRAPCVVDVDGVRVRSHHLRGRLVSPARSSRRRMPAPAWSSWPTARRTTRTSRRCAAST